MVTDTLDIEKLIRVNSLQEIKNPRILTSSLSYQQDGLLSNDIFGYSTKERQTTFAYIDLHGHYIHPLIYKEIIMRSMRILVRVVEGTETVKVIDGKVTPDPDGWTGMEQLYNHWNEITEYGPTPRSIGNVILPHLTRKDVFVDKFVVIPPFFHDADVNTKTKKVKVSELTSMYSKLITDVQFKLNTVTSFDIVSNASVVKIQNQLVIIHLYLSQQLAKKSGYIRRRLLSKKTDYGVRSVITAPSYTGKDIDIDSIRYDRLYIPITQVNGGAYPFIIRFIKNFFEGIDDKIEFDVPHGERKDWIVYHPDIQFDLQYIETLVSNYNKFAETRFDPLTVEIQNVHTKEKARVIMKEYIEYVDERATQMMESVKELKMNPSADIRPLKKKDLITKHFMSWFFKHDEFKDDDPKSFDFGVLVDRAKNHCYGYWKDDKLEGIIRIREKSDYNAISMLFVNRDLHKQGIGTELLKYAIRNYGHKEMRLNVYQTNDVAKKLYEKFGFTTYEDGTMKPERTSKKNNDPIKIYKMKRAASAKTSLFEDAEEDIVNLSSNRKLHPVSPTDICFRAAYDSCYDRFAMFSRYPVLNVYGIFFAKIDVLSTNETQHVIVQGHEYKTYPMIKDVPKEKMAAQFITTIKFSLSRLGGMTGDFDGDTGPIKILYSDEAIAEAKQISESKMDKIDILGTLSKQVENEIGQGVTVLTRKV
jgi:ribosomal protein S18 acetylase RimI-like enzyme